MALENAPEHPGVNEDSEALDNALENPGVEEESEALDNAPENPGVDGQQADPRLNDDNHYNLVDRWTISMELRLERDCENVANKTSDTYLPQLKMKISKKRKTQSAQ